MNIGLLVIATGSAYHGYIAPLLASVERHFMRSHTTKVYLWSDDEARHPVARQTYIAKRPWPYPTLHRYHQFCAAADLLFAENDYLFYVDVDMLFVDDVGDEILGDGLTATLHPCFTMPEVYLPPYESNPKSAAHVPTHRYFAGGFQGGPAAEFLAMAKVIRDRIDGDEANGIIAVWHDESHFNKYLTEHPPAVMLSPSYCYPDEVLPGGVPEKRAHFVGRVWQHDYPAKLLALTKPDGTKV